jgi:hypothetical protein
MPDGLATFVHEAGLDLLLLLLCHGNAPFAMIRSLRHVARDA